MSLAISCIEQDDPLNGYVNRSYEVDQNGVQVQIATFGCNAGYRLKGSSSLRCENVGDKAIGNWSSMVPKCDRKLLFHP